MSTVHAHAITKILGGNITHRLLTLIHLARLKGSSHVLSIFIEVELLILGQLAKIKK
jgi:predicted AAA+ superfamily ATPase